MVCDDCSSKRIRGDRTCSQCWDRIGRKMSGLGLPPNDAAAAAAAAAPPGAAAGAAAANAAGVAGGGVRKSALVSLLEVRLASDPYGVGCWTAPAAVL